MQMKDGRIARIYGKNISLCPVSESDAALFFKWVNDFAVVDWLGLNSCLLTESDERRYVEAIDGKCDKRIFSIVSNVSGELVGNCSCFGIDTLNGVCELGIFIGASDGRGKGYGCEALSLLLDFAFLYLRVECVYLRVLDDNARAIACYEKTGLKHCGRIRRCEYSRGRQHDMLYMDIIKEEWLQMRRSGCNVYSRFEYPDV